MLNRIYYSLFFLLLYMLNANAQSTVRITEELTGGWRFIKADVIGASSVSFNDSDWQKVTIPHDWAIAGPFDRNNDLQKAIVKEDGEVLTTEKTGRTGGLPYQGVGWYRKHIHMSMQDQGKHIAIEFDGAMSHAKVYLNNVLIGEWPYGYTAFNFDLTPYINWKGDNILAVRLANNWESSRWYPGAGIYRHVRLIKTNAVHVAHWGTFVKTSAGLAGEALIDVQTQIDAADRTGNVLMKTEILDQQNKMVAIKTEFINKTAQSINTHLVVSKPKLWSADNPYCYRVQTKVFYDRKLSDRYITPFGIRTIEFDPNKGMLMNNIVTKLKGVCLHSDLGPLGAAINKAALRYRLKLLKAMGCNAIRGTHNPQAPELLDLCDEMGFYFIDEAFDEWKAPKLDNGYHLLFNEWAKKDIEAMVMHDRNHPSLILYSIGNEVREQNLTDGAKVAAYLTDICHRADPTRKVTAGFNNWDAAITNGLAGAVDIPGWNYKPQHYEKIHREHPTWLIYGSETASTVSSRGAYELPAQTAIMKTRPDGQGSAYDLEYCSWSQLPDMEWASQDKNDFVAGEFVWTGVDYLGEPTPYGSVWPSRSSYFGIIDLASLPKDRYYLYQSHWSTNKVLHVLPHWNWNGNEGKTVPVYVYTNYPSAEVWINGKSYGRKSFAHDSLLNTYRLRWENTVYQPGELKVIAYDKQGRKAKTQVIKTAGEPYAIHLTTDRKQLTANGEDLSVVTVTITDKMGNLCPLANDQIKFKVTGAGTCRAAANGDPTSMTPFNAEYMEAFYGKCTVLVQSSGQVGAIKLHAENNGLVSSDLMLNSVHK